MPHLNQKAVNIVAIGNELLAGRTIDTNSSYIARKLLDIGLVVGQVSVVRDVRSEIIKALRWAVNHSDLVITTGGLGPTADDITREAVAELVGSQLELDREALTKLEDFARKRKRPLNDNNRRQAFFPRGADRLINAAGTADAFMVTMKNDLGREVRLIALPGVPREVAYIFEHVLNEMLPGLFPGLIPPAIANLKVFGISEAHIGAVVEKLEIPRNVEVAYRPQFPSVTVSFVSNETDGLERTSAAAELAADALGRDFIFTRNEHETIGHVVGELLRERNMTLAAAESCTGGNLASEVVSVTGASQYFLGSVVTYSNLSKEKFVDVFHDTLAANGAVSEEVAVEMASGARKRFGSDIAISTTGIAGPNGGTIEKPVGTVWFGISTEKRTEAVQVFAPWERNAFRRYCAHMGLDIIRRHLLDLPLSWERK